MRGRRLGALRRRPLIMGIAALMIMAVGAGSALTGPAEADPGTVVAQPQGPFTFTFDTPFSQATGTLQAGATDADPNLSATCCSASLDTAPADGTVTVHADGSFTYLPDPGFLGTDSFTFTLTDSDGNSSLPATVTLSDAPTAQQAPQTLTFTSAPDDPYVGGPPFQVTAQSSAGLGYAVDVYETESVCSANGSGADWAVRFTAPGTCTILALNYGTADWAPAQAELSFTVKAAQSVTFSPAPPPRPTAGTTFSLAATTTSGDPVAFSIDPGSAAICSLDGAVVSFDEIGTCLILASTPGDVTYGPATGWQSLQVQGAPQTVAFSSTAPLDGVVGGETYTPVAAASTGLPVTFSTYGFFTGTTIPVCYMSGSVLVFWAIGTCHLVAGQAGNDVNASAAAEQSFPVVGTPQAITITSGAPARGIVAGPTYKVSATASSGLPVAISIDAGSTPGACTVSGVTVSFLRPGTCVIDANQAGNETFAAAAKVAQSILVTTAPRVCSASGSQCFTSGTAATAAVGARLSFPVMTTGSPKPKVTEKGALPKGVTFNRSTGVLGGVPASTVRRSAVGTYPLTFTATFGRGRDKVVLTQTFTLRVT